MLGKKLHVKKGDTVVVTTGKDKSKSGKVLRMVPKKDGVIVEGLNVVKRHTRARGNEDGGIV
ncbi:MAG: 50S ribosomal protein L24, partial [Geobacter sp.]|nr:50S ribosomal protein L24 [Geobacter sp.]